MAKTILAALLFALLSACGGGGSEADNSDQDPMSASVASGHIDATPPAGYGFNVYTPVTTLTWTNATAVTVFVQIDHAINGFQTVAGPSTGGTNFAFGWSVSNQGGAQVTASPYLTTTDTTYSSSQQVRVAAGATLTAKLYAVAILTSGSQMRNNFHNGRSRLTLTIPAI